MGKLVQFKCFDGQAVRKQPNQFMAEKKDALLWQSIGIGQIIEPLPVETSVKNEPALTEPEKEEVKAELVSKEEAPGEAPKKRKLRKKKGDK